ncbi:MAG: DUF58 domain-containing protein [Candidatus Sedimenticola sp. (ex Thyasira tokunagai)]
MSAVHATLDELIRLRGNSRGLVLGAQRRSLSAQSGGYLSVYRGRGLEFDEVRAYQPGDDVRTIDWRVTARRGRTHTKLFREERERPVLLLADFHPGMYFGSRQQFKSVLAARAAALVAWSAVRAGDRVGGVVSGVEGHSIIPPRSRQKGILALLKVLEQQQPTAPGEVVDGRLDQALAQLRRVAHPGSMVLLLSDFSELGEEGEHHLSSLSRHCDVLLGFIHDPLELLPPRAGRYRLGTPGHQIELNTASSVVVDSWRSGFEQRHQRLQLLSRRYGLPLMELSTAGETVDALRRGMAKHGRWI